MTLHPRHAGQTLLGGDDRPFLERDVQAHGDAEEEDAEDGHNADADPERGDVARVHGPDEKARQKQQRVGQAVRERLVYEGEGLATTCAGGVEGRAEMRPGVPRQQAEDSEYAHQASEKANPGQAQASPPERRHHGVELGDGEDGPGSDEPAAREEERDDRGDEDLRLGADDLVEEDVAPAQRCREEKGDLGLGEFDAAFIARKGPHQDGQPKHRGRGDVDEDAVQAELGERHSCAPAAAAAHAAKDDEVEIRRTGDGSEEVSRVAQPLQPGHDPVDKRLKGDEGEGADHLDSLVAGRCSLFVVRCSLFAVRCSLFAVRCSFVAVRWCVLTTNH